MATYEVNPDAVAHARRLIDAKQYVLDSDWGAVQPRTEAENAYLDERIGTQAIGSLDRVRGRIDALVGTTGADEVIVVPQGPDLTTRERTLRALGDGLR